MKALLFFGTYDASDVGIDQLSVGCDRSLDEPDPVVRLQGRDTHGDLLFDHTLIRLTALEARALVGAIDDKARATTDSVTLVELESLRRRIAALMVQAQYRDRLDRVLGALAERERLTLADEGHTTIVCECEHPESFAVHRWGGLVADGKDRVDALDLALNDRGLPRTENVVGPRGG